MVTCRSEGWEAAQPRTAKTMKVFHPNSGDAESDPCREDGPMCLRRKCTDLTFFLLIVVSWIAMTIIGFSAIGIWPSQYIHKGNPQLLLKGIDYEGNICGVNGPVQHLSLKWTPNPFGLTVDSRNNYVPPGFGICVSSCPTAQEKRSDPYNIYGNWTSPVVTYDILGYCLSAQEKKATTVGATVFADFINASGEIGVIGFLFSVGASILFLLVMRVPGVLRSVVWLCITLVFAVMAGGGYLFTEQAKYESNTNNQSLQSDVEVWLLKTIGGFLLALAVGWVCVVFFMRERISLAIGLVKEAAAALTAMPLLCVFPLFYTFIFGIFTAIWLLYCVYLISSGDLVSVTDAVTGISYKEIVYDHNSKMAIIFMLFVWFWTTAFLEAFGQIASAHAVLSWFFNCDSHSVALRTSEDNHDTGGRRGEGVVKRDCCGVDRVLHSVMVCFKCHMGTAALGSLVIAAIRTLRMILEYIKQHLLVRDAPDSDRTDRCALSSCARQTHNSLIRLVGCCLSCCLCCFEHCIKFLNKHAYIQCALRGGPFCLSARRAFGMIFRNLGRVAAVSAVGDFVVLIGKLSISLSCGAVGYWYLRTFMSARLSGFVLPTALIVFVAFFTATLFLGVASAAADTILQAFIYSEECDQAASGKDDTDVAAAAAGEHEESKADSDIESAPTACSDVAQRASHSRTRSHFHSTSLSDYMATAQQQLLYSTLTRDEDMHCNDDACEGEIKIELATRSQK